MNLLNEKARILRTQIAAEKERPNPNWSAIQELQRELNLCLEGLNEY